MNKIITESDLQILINSIKGLVKALNQIINHVLDSVVLTGHFVNIHFS